MADDIPVNTLTGDPKVRTKDDSTRHWPASLAAIWDSGAGVLIDQSNPLPVKTKGVVDSTNSSTTPLTASAVFTGTATDVSDYASVSVQAYADVAGTLELQWSINGTNWDVSDSYAVAAGVGLQVNAPRAANHFRVVFTDGGSGQATFRLETMLNPFGVSNGGVAIEATAAGGVDQPFHDNDLDETAVAVKASAGRLLWIHAINLGTTPRYLQLFDVAQGSVTVGTTTPKHEFVIPSQGDANGAGFFLAVPTGITFSTAITAAATTNSGGNGAPGANEVHVNMGYA